MDELLAKLTEYSVFFVTLLALVTIMFGAVEAALRTIPAMFRPSGNGTEMRHGYIRFARWLVAGLTFQLAADVMETAISPNWEDIGQLGAIAVIRTFLSYFLERDMKELAEIVVEKGDDE